MDRYTPPQDIAQWLHKLGTREWTTIIGDGGYKLLFRRMLIVDCSKSYPRKEYPKLCNHHYTEMLKKHSEIIRSKAISCSLPDTTKKIIPIYHIHILRRNAR